MKSLLSALIVTVALGATPALAQSGEPSASFSLNLGNGQSTLSLGIESESPQQGNNTFRHGGGNNNGRWNDACLSDRQVIRGLRDYGFQRVEVADSSRRRAEVIGRWGRWDYLMRVSKCTGEVDVLDRFRRNNRNGFGLQFNFN
jgi:hypothetical protein